MNGCCGVSPAEAAAVGTGALGGWTLKPGETTGDTAGAANDRAICGDEVAWVRARKEGVGGKDRSTGAGGSRRGKRVLLGLSACRRARVSSQARY